MDETIKDDDLIFLKVKGKDFKEAIEIYCIVEKVSEKSISVTDLREEKNNGKYNYYLEPSNPTSKRFGNSYNRTRNIQV